MLRSIVSNNTNSRNVTVAINTNDCRALRDAYDSAISSWYQTHTATGGQTSIVSYTDVLTQTLLSEPLYTLSDGYPRASTTITVKTYEETFEGTNTITVLSDSFSVSQPDCSGLTLGCGDCTIFGNAVQLVYWPVNTASGNPNSTITPTITGPILAIANGSTYTSPTVYLSYQSVYAANSCGLVGKNYSGAILSLSPNAVSSIRGYHGIEGVRLINYADYNTPIAPSAWLGQGRCINPVNCLPIVDDEFRPILVVPEQVRALDHAWATCLLDFQGSYDPPRALSPVQALASTTSTLDPHTKPAAPLAPIPAPASSTVQTVAVSLPANSGAGSSLSPPSPSKDPTVHSFVVYGDPSLDPSPTTDPKVNSAAPVSPDPNSIDYYRYYTAAVLSSVVSPAAEVSPASGVKPISTVAQAGPEATSLNPEASQSTPPTDRTATVALGSQEYTLNAGSPLVTISGQLVSISSTGVILNGEYVSYFTQDPSINQGLISTIGSQTYTTAPKGMILESTTISVGGPTATIPSHFVSIGTQGAVFGSESIPFSILSPNEHISSPAAQATRSAMTFKSLKFTADPTKGFYISGQTLTPGGVITISGTPITLALSATALIVGSATVNIGPMTSLPVLIIGSQIVAADSAGKYIVAGQTLNPGGTIAVSGTTLSFAPSATAPVTGSSTLDLASESTLGSLTIGQQTLTTNSAGRYIVAGQPLTPGGVITISGIRISLAVSGTALIIGFTTTDLASTTLPALPTLIIGSQKLTADAASKYAIAGQTLIPGADIIVSGTPISLAPSASALVVGSSTEVLSGISTSSGLAGLILNAFGGPDGGTTPAMSGNYIAPVFTGGTMKNLQASLGAVVGVLGLSLVL